MPNDATHRIINYLLLSIFIILNFYFNIENDFRPIIIFFISYLLGTEILSPDLDTDSRPSHRLGFLSYPIRKLSKHRGFGHNIFIGWVLKIVYLIFIIAIIVLVVNIFGYDTYWVLKYIGYKDILAFLLGLFLSNALHIIADYLN